MPVILATLSEESAWTEAQGQPGQKVSKTPSQPIKAGNGGKALSSSFAGNVNRRIPIQVGLRPYWKNKAKRAGGCGSSSK
jgi:hypothetical protein